MNYISTYTQLKHAKNSIVSGYIFHENDAQAAMYVCFFYVEDLHEAAKSMLKDSLGRNYDFSHEDIIAYRLDSENMRVSYIVNECTDNCKSANIHVISLLLTDSERKSISMKSIIMTR
jgi:hypothetical protein